jgi:hypothetical protein
MPPGEDATTKEYKRVDLRKMLRLLNSHLRNQLAPACVLQQPKANICFPTNNWTGCASYQQGPKWGRSGHTRIRYFRIGHLRQRAVIPHRLALFDFIIEIEMTAVFDG